MNVLAVLSRRSAASREVEQCAPSGWRVVWLDPSAGSHPPLPNDALLLVADNDLTAVALGNRLATEAPGRRVWLSTTVGEGEAEDVTEDVHAAIATAPAYVDALVDAIGGAAKESGPAAGLSRWRAEVAPLLTRCPPAIRAGSLTRAARAIGVPIARLKAEAKVAEARAKRPDAAPAAPGVLHAAPGAVTNYEAVREPDGTGSEQVVRYRRDLTETVADVHRTCHGWPRSCAGVLFAPSLDGRGVEWLRDEGRLTAWIQRHAPMRWTGREVAVRGEDGACAPVSRGELLRGLESLSPERYTSIEALPHHPPIEGCYYLPRDLPEATGDALAEFVGMFNADSAVDRQLLKAALLTLFWGAQPGTRPAIVIVSEHGTGAGKTETAHALAAAAGGCLQAAAKEDWGRLCERLLDPATADKRAILVDNLKGRLDRGDVEAAITSPDISGRRLYVGNGSRTNNLTWLLTSNLAELSRDLAGRSLVVRIGPPQHEVDFRDLVTGWLREHGPALVADCIAALAGPAQGEIAPGHSDRFQAWQRAVLTRCQDPDALAVEIQARRRSVDADASWADQVVEAIDALCTGRGVCPVHRQVWIATGQVLEELQRTGLIDQRTTPVGLGIRLRVLAQEPGARHLTPGARRSGTGARGLLVSRATAEGGQVSLPPAPTWGDRDGDGRAADCDRCRAGKAGGR